MIAGAAHLVLMLLDLAILATLARRGTAGIIAAVVAAGLAYDTGVLAAGAVVGSGDALMHANAGRYVIHAVLVPVLLPIAVVLANPQRGLEHGPEHGPERRGGIVAPIAAAVLAVALGVLGYVQEVQHLVLVPHEAANLVRYVPAEISGPPIPAIVATLALLIAGVLRWRRGGGVTLAVAALCCFVGSAAMNVTDPPVLGSVVETVLLAGIASALSAGRATAAEGRAATAEEGATLSDGRAGRRAVGQVGGRIAPREDDPAPAFSLPQAPDAARRSPTDPAAGQPDPTPGRPRG